MEEGLLRGVTSQSSRKGTVGSVGDSSSQRGAVVRGKDSGVSHGFHSGLVTR